MKRLAATLAAVLTAPLLATLTPASPARAAYCDSRSKVARARTTTGYLDGEVATFDFSVIVHYRVCAPGTPQRTAYVDSTMAAVDSNRDSCGYVQNFQIDQNTIGIWNEPNLKMPCIHGYSYWNYYLANPYVDPISPDDPQGQRCLGFAWKIVKLNNYDSSGSSTTNVCVI